MNKLLLLITLPIVVLAGGCAPDAMRRAADAIDGGGSHNDTAMLAGAPETVLLVSLADGSVVKQSIAGTADICFKQNANSETRCLTQGEPIVDPHTRQVIAYEMYEDTIHLYPGD